MQTLDRMVEVMLENIQSMYETYRREREEFVLCLQSESRYLGRMCCSMLSIQSL